MKTAVEWFSKNLKDFPHIKHSQSFKDLVIKAKEMEKEQHYQTWNNAYDKGTRDRLEKVVDPVGDADTYFKETFKTE
jgi:hypothetical protein